MTSSNEKSPKQKDCGFIHKNQTYKVFLINDRILNEHSDLEVILLRNPHTTEGSQYIVNSSNSDHQINEILRFSEPYRSWFIDDTVSSNGNLYITTPIDPLFLIINYLQEKCIEKYIPIDDIVVDDEYPKTSIINDFLSTEQLLLVADCKSIGDLRAFKFNESKTLNWLSFKCKNLVDGISKNQVQTTTDTQCATFVKSEKLEENKKDDELLYYAHGLLSEYISPNLSKKLQLHLGLEDRSTIKRKSSQKLDNTKSKRSKKDNLIDADDEPFYPSNSINNNQKKAEKKVSASEKALKKAASKTKSITSFFKIK